MAEAAEAVARLRLDATGFDKQANASFREFSKQLTSVKDATDVAMRGAEALQKVFVKSLGGTIAIGAANALGDAMRDVGAKIGSAGQLAADAQAGMKGLAQSFEEGAARAEKLNAAAAGVAKTLEELKNSSPVQAAIFKAFGGEQTLNNLQESIRGAADAEMMAGAIQAKDRARKTAGMSPEQLRGFDLELKRNAERAQARRIADLGVRTRTLAALDERYATEDVEAQDKFFRDTDPDRIKARTGGFDGDLYDMQRNRERERMRADFNAGLADARAKADELEAARRAEDQNLNTMRIVETQVALADAEEKRKILEKRVVETDAAASKIAQGVGGSARGLGQRMTSTEVGINRAVERAFNDQTLRSSKEYRSQIADDLKAQGKSSDGYAVNKEIQRRRAAGAEQQARAPFEAASQAKADRDSMLAYMQDVKNILNELKTYAHAT
jgi:hypothetical protein